VTDGPCAIPTEKQIENLSLIHSFKAEAVMAFKEAAV
jgi:hypothetical protein